MRLLGYSSIAHAGFMLVPFAMAAAFEGTALQDAFFGSVTYLLVYAFMNLGAFAAVIAIAERTGSREIDDWAGLARYAPVLASLLGVFFFSLAGIPPLAGWFAKFVMFKAVLGDGAATWGIALAVVAAVNAVISLFFYARVLKVAFMDPAPEVAARGGAGSPGRWRRPSPSPRRWCWPPASTRRCWPSSARRRGPWRCRSLSRCSATVSPTASGRRGPSPSTSSCRPPCTTRTRATSPPARCARPGKATSSPAPR